MFHCSAEEHDQFASVIFLVESEICFFDATTIQNHCENRLKFRIQIKSKPFKNDLENRATDEPWNVPINENRAATPQRMSFRKCPERPPLSIYVCNDRAEDDADARR